jgi:hypothetical protein
MTWGVLPIRSTWPRRVATPTPYGKLGPRARGRSRHSPRGREARRWVARLRASLGRVYDPVQPAGGADAVTRAAHPWRWAPKNRPCLSTPLHTFRSLISMAMEGLKTLWLMPGGIVVARRVSGGGVCASATAGASRLVATWLMRRGRGRPRARFGGYLCHAVRSAPRVRLRDRHHRPTACERPWGVGQPGGIGGPRVGWGCSCKRGGARFSGTSLIVRPTPGLEPTR